MKTISVIISMLLSFASFSQTLIIDSDTLSTPSLNSVSMILPDEDFWINDINYSLKWEIKNDKLYLIDIQDLNIIQKHDFNYIQVEMNILFKDKIENEKVFADWVTDTLVINYGKKLPFPRMGKIESDYTNYYENTKCIYIDNGIIVNIVDFLNIKRKDSAISIFDINTIDTIISTLNIGINWDNIPFSKEILQRTWIQDIFVLKIYIDGSSEIENYDSDGIAKGNYSCGECIEEIQRKIEVNRVLSTLKFDRILEFGKLVDVEIVFDIEYDLVNKRIINPYNDRE